MNLNVTHHSNALDSSAYTDGMSDRTGKLTEAEMNAAILDQRRMHDEIDESMAARWNAMQPVDMTKPPRLPEDARRAIWRGCAVVAVVLALYGAFVAYLYGRFA